jgi:hypothetical protein
MTGIVNYLIGHNFILLLSLSGILLLLGILWVLNRVFSDFIVILLAKIYKRIINFSKKANDRGYQHSLYIDINMQNIVSEIHSLLAELRVNMYSDRAYIYEFENGTEFLSKFPKWKTSKTYEKARNGISYESHNLQDIPATYIWNDFLKIFFIEDDTLLPPGISIIRKNSFCEGTVCEFPRRIYYIDVELMDYNIGPMRSIFENQGVYYTLRVPILNSSEKIIGFIGVDYCNKDENLKKNVNISPCHLCRLASRIALLWEADSDNKKKMMEFQKLIIHES